MYEGSNFSTSLTTLIFIYRFGSNHLSGCEVVFYCSLDLYLPDGLSTFSCVYWLLVYLLWRNVYSNSLPILNCLLIIELHVFFLYPRYKSLSNYMVCNYFLIFCHKGAVICTSEVIDISPGNLDSSLCFFQPSISHEVLCI